MALSDCVKCWETPCRCGHDYRNWSEKALLEQIEMLKKVLEEKTKKNFTSLGK